MGNTVKTTEFGNSSQVFSASISGLAATSGNLLILSIAVTGGGDGFPASPGNNWTLIEGHDKTGSGQWSVHTYVKEAQGSTSDDVTISWTDNARWSAIVTERSGNGTYNFSNIISAQNEDITNVAASVGSQGTGSATPGISNGVDCVAVLAVYNVDDWANDLNGSGVTVDNSFGDAHYHSQAAGNPLIGHAFKEHVGTTAQSATFTKGGSTNRFAYGHILIIEEPGIPQDIAHDQGQAALNYTDGDSVNEAIDGWTGSETPFTYAEFGSALSGSGLTVDSTGGNCTLQGTAEEGTYTGVVIRGTDQNTNTADTNTFNITVAAAAGDDVVITEATPDNNFVYPLRLATSTAEFSRTGTYTGTPTSLEYRIVRASDSAEVVTWTTFDASPSSGTWTLSVNVPPRTYPMRLEVRFGNNTSINDQEIGTWRVGCRVVIMGQSNAMRLTTEDTITRAESHVRYTGAAFSDSFTLGGGEQGLADLLSDMYNCSVVVYNSGAGSTQLTQLAAGGPNAWANVSSSLFSNTVTDVGEMTNSDNLLHIVAFMQGSGDAGIEKSDYLGMGQSDGLCDFVKNCRDSWTHPDGVILPVAISSTTNVGSGDAAIQKIKEAQLHYTTADDNAYSITQMHYPVPDGSHLDDASQIETGQVVAAFVALHNGDISVGPPRLAGVTLVNTTTIDLEFDQDLDTAVTTYGTADMRVLDNGTPVTVSNLTRTGTRTVRLVTSTAITNTDAITLQLGYGDGNSNSGFQWIYSGSITLPGTGGSFKFPAELVAATVYERTA